MCVCACFERLSARLAPAEKNFVIIPYFFSSPFFFSTTTIIPTTHPISLLLHLLNMSSNSLLNSTLSQISLLTPDNWFTWKTEIMMLLGMEGLDGIVEGTEKKDDAKEKDIWEQKDKRSKGVLFFRIDSQYRSLFTSSSTSTSHELWKALKDKFEASNLASRIDARRKLYTTLHDPSKSVDFYILALKNARDHLKAITGEDIKDQDFMDVLLMNLHPDFSQIRTSILSQSTEPSLATVISILTKSAADITTTSIIKQESVLAARSSPFTTGGSGLTDDKGFRWCDTKREGVCHRCGKPGHQAHMCAGDMPTFIKDWVLKRPHSASC